MENSFWLFCTLLIVLTLLASLGGGIRYRENFINEVFENINSNDYENEPEDEYTVTKDDIVEKLSFSTKEKFYDPIKESASELANFQSDNSVSTNLPTDNLLTQQESLELNEPMKFSSSNDDIIEGFDGDLYSPF